MEKLREFCYSCNRFLKDLIDKLTPLSWKCGGLEMYSVYILKSLVKERFYIGHTSDLQKRLNEHNSGRTKSTKPYIPWAIVHIESYETKSEAYKRELQIKSFKSGIKFKQLLKMESWQSG